MTLSILHQSRRIKIKTIVELSSRKFNLLIRPDSWPVSVVMFRCNFRYIALTLLLMLLFSHRDNTNLSWSEGVREDPDKFWPNYCLLRSLPLYPCQTFTASTPYLYTRHRHHHHLASILYQDFSIRFNHWFSDPLWKSVDCKSWDDGTNSWSIEPSIN